MHRTFSIFLATAFLLMLSVIHAADQARPNILFIYTNDQYYGALSILQKERGEKGRFPWLKTPNPDRFIAVGVRFKRTICGISGRNCGILSV